MVPKPSSAWYASGLRWIASGMVWLADAIDRRAPQPWPLEPAPEYRPVDEFLLEARNRASRGL